MSTVPPHINSDPSPPIERPYHSPAQGWLASPDTVQSGVQCGRPTYQENQHIWNCERQLLMDNARFSILGFGVLVLGILHLLGHHWGRTALMALYLVLLLAAPYYANRLRIQHPCARFVRRLFFEIFTHPSALRPPKILARIFPMMFIPISSLVLLFWP